VTEQTVTVSAVDLRAVLMAAVGPPHLIRELQAIRILGNSPIDRLVEQFNAQVNEEPKGMISIFQLDFQQVGVVPAQALEDRDVVLYNPCDGYHIATIHFDDEGMFDGFWPFGGKEFTEDHYCAWALLPDCNADLRPVFAAEDDVSSEVPRG
jgi:hypothetical protein